MSLRLKTIIGVALIEAMLLLLLVTVALNYLRSTNNEGLVKRAQTIATLFAATTEDAVLSYDLATLESYAEGLIQSPDLVYARVLGPDDILFAEAGDTSHINGGFIQDRSIDTVDDRVFDSQALIVGGGVQYGKVQVGIDVNSIDEAIAEARSRSAIIALIEMSLVALFSFLLGTYLTRQLSGLQQAARRISKGNYDINLRASGKDEIAQVARGFNAMAHSLRDTSRQRDLYETALETLNRELEERVEKRTQQLSEKNNELGQAYADLKSAQEGLLRSAKMASLGQMAAGVAHEINNPLSFTMSNLQSLKQYTESYRSIIADYEGVIRSDAPEDVRVAKIAQLQAQYDLAFLNEDIDELMHDSVEGLERVREIVKGLREFSHAGSDTEYEMTDLNECIQTSLKMANNELKYHCEVVTELSEVPSVYCNHGQINQVLLNLLVNAGQAIEGQGTITVTNRVLSDRVEVRVSDTGKGMTPEQVKKVFDPFFTTKPVGQGTGLGLAICYGIIKDHGGSISVESEPGKGSTFMVTLPLEVPISQ